MKFMFSVLFFDERFGEENVNYSIYAKDVANAWNKLFFQLNLNHLFNNVVSIYLTDLNFDDEYSNFPYVCISNDEK